MKNYATQIKNDSILKNLTLPQKKHNYTHHSPNNTLPPPKTKNPVLKNHAFPKQTFLMHKSHSHQEDQFLIQTPSALQKISNAHQRNLTYRSPPNTNLTTANGQYPFRKPRNSLGYQDQIRTLKSQRPMAQNFPRSTSQWDTRNRINANFAYKNLQTLTPKEGANSAYRNNSKLVILNDTGRECYYVDKGQG